MTTWLVDPDSRPADMVIGDQAELKTRGDDGVIRSRQVDLDSDDLQRLLECGRQASKLALGLEGKIRFVLHDDLAIKGIRFDDALIDEANQADDGDDAVARLETDFLLMAQALGTSIDWLVTWMGGEAQRHGVSHNDDLMKTDSMNSEHEMARTERDALSSVNAINALGPRV